MAVIIKSKRSHLSGGRQVAAGDRVHGEYRGDHGGDEEDAHTRPFPLYISSGNENMILLLLNLTAASKVSDQLMKMLGLTLPPLPSLKQTKSLEPNVAAASISPVVAPPAPVDLVPGFNPSE